MGLGLESVPQVPVPVLNPGGPIHNFGQWNLGPGAPPQSGHNPVPRLPVPGPVTHWAQDPGFPVSWLPIPVLGVPVPVPGPNVSIPVREASRPFQSKVSYSRSWPNSGTNTIPRLLDPGPVTAEVPDPGFPVRLVLLLLV